MRSNIPASGTIPRCPRGGFHPRDAAERLRPAPGTGKNSFHALPNSDFWEDWHQDNSN